MENITIRIIDPRTDGQFDYSLDADLSDQLLASILAHTGYSGDGSGAMACAIDYWINQSQQLLESQIRTAKSAEAEAQISVLRAQLGQVE